MDETGQSGDAGAADGGTGSESRDRTLLNGWASRDSSPWSNAGSALDPETDVPAWRRPATEIRPYTQEPRPLPTDRPSGEIRPFAAPPPPPSFKPASQPPPSGDDFPGLENAAAPRWSDSRARYQDLLAHLSPNGNEPRQNEPPRAAEPPVRPDPLSPELLRPGAQETSELRAVGGDLPASAPPYPYEGDLDDVRREAPQPRAGQQRASLPAERPFPAVRPAAPGARRVDWSTGDSARHALDPPTPMEGLPRVAQTPVTDESRSVDQGQIRPSYDPSSFPRRLPYERAETGYAEPSPYPGATGDPGAGLTGEPPFPALPQRVPAQPDVPTVPEPPPVEPTAETPALARIATHLRRGDLPPQDRQEGFDVNAILAAVREVEGVRDASLRTTPAGAHSLRLDLSDGADPAEVSRQVARLLQDRMGLDAAMPGALTPPKPPAPVIPAQAAPSAPPQPPGFTQTPPQVPAPVSPPAAAPAPVSAPPAPVVPAQYAPAPSPDASFTGPSWGSPSGTTLSPSFGPLSSSSSSSSSLMGTGLPHTGETGPPRPLEIGDGPGPRVLIENVQVNTFGTEATVEVRLAVGNRVSTGVATGPAVDGYLLRLCAMATGQAIDELLSKSDHVDGPAKCFVEHAASVPFGPLQVAVVVLLLSCGGWVEQLAGSAVITGDDRHAMVRATLAAVNRRLEALLS